VKRNRVFDVTTVASATPSADADGGAALAAVRDMLNARTPPRVRRDRFRPTVAARTHARTHA
jgi:hypothetical protein